MTPDEDMDVENYCSECEGECRQEEDGWCGSQLCFDTNEHCPGDHP